MVATETLQKPIEEPGMDTRKEVFLKDYKIHDYYFDMVHIYLKQNNIYGLGLHRVFCGICFCVCKLIEL